MKTTKRPTYSVFRFLLPILFGALLSSPLTAGTFVTLRGFDAAATTQAGLIQGSDGAFYGTNDTGGANGQGGVYRVNSDGSGYTSLHSFTGTDGAVPLGPLMQGTDGALYGTTSAGGAHKTGTIFKINTNGSGFTLLYSFSATDSHGDNTDGAVPVAALMQGSDDVLYGTTSAGGPNGAGVIFSISVTGTSYTALYAFTATDGLGNNTDGAAPLGALVEDANGLFYGTTSQGGPNGSGVIFQWSSTDSTYTVLHNFSAPDANGENDDGASPYAGLTYVPIPLDPNNGILYGTTPYGGPNGSGGVFMLDLRDVNDSFSLLHAFSATDKSSTNSDGASPFGPLIRGTDGALYGTASQGGVSGYGTVFRLTSDGSSYSAIHAFSAPNSSSPDGATPNTGLVEGSDGVLYGTTSQGGANGTGTLFRLISTQVHVLWSKTDGTLSLWAVNPAGQFTQKTFGPYTGWTPRFLADGVDGKTRILWSNVNGLIALWLLDNTTGIYINHQYGPYSGWTAVSLAVGPDNYTHILWNHTPDGQMSLWNVAPTGTFTSKTYGPYSGWTATSLGVGGDGIVHILWDNPTGKVALWNVSASGSYSSLTIPSGSQTYPNWSGVALAVAPDNSVRVLWNHAPDNQMSLWQFPVSGTITHQEYGPFSGWTALGLAVGSDNQTRILWKHVPDALMAFWTIGSSGSYINHQYGPYTGWSATSLTVGIGPALGGSAQSGNAKPASAASAHPSSVSAHQLRPHRVRTIDSGRTFGDWGEIGTDHLLALPDSVVIVPVYQPTNSTAVTELICVLDPLNQLGVPGGSSSLQEYNYTPATGPDSAAAIDGTASQIASDAIGNLYCAGPSVILMKHFDDDTDTSGETFTATNRDAIPAGGPASAMIVDGAQNVFFARNNQVYLVNPNKPVPPLNLHLGSLDNITGLAVATNGSLYLAAGQIYKYLYASNQYSRDTSFSTLSDPGLPSGSPYYPPTPLQPTRLAIDNSTSGTGDLYVTDENNNRIVEFSTSGKYVGDLNTTAIVAPGRDNRTAGLLHPRGITVASDGILWVVEHGQTPGAQPYNNRIVAFP